MEGIFLDTGCYDKIILIHKKKLALTAKMVMKMPHLFIKIVH